MNDKEREELYNKIKKRLRDYRYRSGFFTLGTMAFAVLLIFSLFPLIPVLIIDYLGLPYSDWASASWFICIVAFGGLFWIFQRYARKIEAKRGITLEEKMYVPAYEALCFLKEYLDPNHPIFGSKTKAIRRLQSIDYLLVSIGLPFVSIIREEAVQLRELRENLKYRLIPSIKNVRQSNPKAMEAIYPAVTELVDYLSNPVLPGLVALNGRMVSLPTVTEKGISEALRSAIIRRSNLRHTVVFSFFVIFASFVYYVDINYFDATMNAAFEFALMFFVGIVAIYVTYLGLTWRREPRT